MKLKLHLLLLLLLHVVVNSHAQDFVTRWDLSKSPGSGSKQITFNAIIAAGNANYIWKEISPRSSSGSGTLTAVSGIVSIKGLPSNSIIRLSIAPTNLKLFSINNGTDRLKLIDIEKWGTANWASMNGAFYGCENMVCSASDNPNLAAVKDMGNMFNGCSLFNGKIKTWSTAAVTNMSNMFNGAVAFNQNIGSWNTGAVTNMAYMFNGAAAFNQDIGAWNTAAVTNMTNMFNGAAAFNQSINNWNTASVTSMSYMFYNASNFNKSIGSWTLKANVNITNMLSNNGMDCNSYSSTLIGWSANPTTPNNKTLGAIGRKFGTNAVAARTYLISKGWIFSGDVASGTYCNNDNFLTRWDLSKPSTAGNNKILFFADIAIGGATYTWKEISPGSSSGSGVLIAGNSLKTITGLPANAIIQLSIAPTKLKRFYIDDFTDKYKLIDIENWGTANWTSMEGAFFGCENMVYSASDKPNLGAVTNMESMFRICRLFNGNINSWDVSNITNMRGMFSAAVSVFNQPLDNWNTANVRNMQHMFSGAEAFNQPIGNWNTANVIDMQSMFSGAKVFNQPIGNWNTAKVTNMMVMFASAKVFNQPIGNWNTGNVTNMQYMFYNAETFNQPIGNWNTGNVTNMQYMFYYAEAFNQPIGNWNTASVTNMSFMFQYAPAFNQAIGNWNTGNVIYMLSMFNSATAFNQSIDNWNTANVTDMRSMFKNATAFNQPIGDWTLKTSVNLDFMFENSGLDCGNYTKTLIGWSNNPLCPSGRNLGAIGMQYGTNAVAARNSLLTKGWTITGDAPSGTNCNNDFFTRWDLSKFSTSGNNKITFNALIATGGATYTWKEISPGSSSGSGVLIAGNSLKTISGLPANAIIQLSIYPNNLKRFYIDNGVDRKRLIDLENWGTSNWSSMEVAFKGCENMSYSAPDIPNLSGVTNMSNMFANCFIFNGNINSWDVSNITNMSTMFYYAKVFNQPLDNWDTASVTNMSSMFSYAGAFNQPIGNWNTGKVTDMGSMFYRARTFNQPLDNWNTGSVTNMGGMFHIATAFNQPIGNWNTANVTTTTLMFAYSESFNQAIGNWNTANVTDMRGMFEYSIAFNQPIGNWNTENVTDMERMFIGAYAFNRPIGNWNTSSVTNMRDMFYSAKVFNQEIANWNTENVIYMQSMFAGAIAFDQPIGDWNTGKVKYMLSMFDGAIAFDQPIGNWNTSKVTDMQSMFSSATAFNQPIGNWNTENVHSMQSMFRNATTFNQPIGDWNTSKINFTPNMFNGASAFNQSLENWTLNFPNNLGGMFSNSGLDCGNYTKTLIGWSNNPLTFNNLIQPLGADGLYYGTDAIAARNNLIINKGWTITGDAVFAPFNTLVPPATEEVADMNCDYFTSPLDHHRKLIDIDPNGNAFDYDNTTVTITNKFVSSIPSHVTTHTPGTTGYYQTASGTNCFRLGRRMHSIEAPGTYSINDGIKVRVYFNAEDTTYIRTDVSPTSPINFSGWLKVELHDPQPIVNSMNTAAPELPIPTKIVFPIATGIENGSYYAEFLAEEFSTFVYYAATIIPLPVTLSEWSTSCSEKEVNLKWTTQSELNNNYFIIEGSKDAQNWLEVYRTNGAGNSNSEIEYAYQLPATDNSYFRLGQVDYDGIKTYSNILHTDCGNSLNDIVIYPNPNFGTFKIKGLSDNASVTLYSISGQMLWESSNLKSDETINLDYLPKGIYNISIVSNNEMKNHKLIIAK